MDAHKLQPLPSGLVAVTGDEGTGKTALLRSLGPDAFWLDLALPDRDQDTADDLWRTLRLHWPHWDASLQEELVQALDLLPHRNKKLFMLSTGSRRKVALVALLASGARVTCLDQPFAALDAPSARVILDFLTDVAGDTERTWVVADYEAQAQLPWRLHVSLP